MSDQYYLPQETVNLLTQDRLRQCKNLGLILDKYPPRTAVDKSEGKSVWFKGFESDNHIDIRLAEHVYRRWRNTITAMQAEYFTATTQWRMVVGLGGETVLETDLALHHLYGIPFIPGSALKGLTRAYVTGEIIEHKSKKIDDDDPVVQRIFGTQKDAGSVIFFDAMPVDGKVEIDLDIMNAHYPKYYGEKQLPTNSQDPNPVTFLTVTNTTFVFALAPRQPKDTADMRQAIKWLQEALQEYGVGGKTSAGYGYFKKELSPREKPHAPVVQAASRPVEHIRPKVPQFREGLEIKGAVVSLTDELRRRLPPEVKAVLRYESFPTTEAVMVVNEEEAQNWKPGETRICVFEREQEHDGLVIWVCKPRVKRDKKK